MMLVNTAPTKEALVAQSNILEYIQISVIKNRHQIAHTIRTRDESPQHIIHIYTDVILRHTLEEQYSKEQLLDIISSGVLFRIRSEFVERLVDQEVIRNAIEDKVKSSEGSLLIG